VRILVLNSGSSSIKYELYDMADRSLLIGGAAERIGEPGSDLVDHAAALDQIMSALADAGALDDGSELLAIGHRVVHGGEAFREPCIIDEQVIETIRALSSLAPLHNPANLMGIEVAMARRPDVPQVAVFDTAFHHSIPPRAYRYAVPEDWYREHGVRRYGFHGTSHAFVTKQAARALGRPLEESNLIVLHLGNGASVTAVKAGKSIDTSMGLTPLEGLVMGTRGGDLDPGALLHMARHAGLSVDEVDTALNRASGLVGLCGASDMRDILRREAEGDARAKLALEVYVYRIRKYVGAYAMALGRVDAIVFTAGVGENSPEIRERVCAGLEALGVRLDSALNRSDANGARAIHEKRSSIAVWVIPTDEELEIADQALRCVEGRA
jgi:acetate kinase